MVALVAIRLGNRQVPQHHAGGPALVSSDESCVEFPLVMAEEGGEEHHRGAPGLSVPWQDLSL